MLAETSFVKSNDFGNNAGDLKKYERVCLLIFRLDFPPRLWLIPDFDSRKCLDKLEICKRIPLCNDF